MRVVKRSGEREEYDRSKTIRAIMRAGVDATEAEAIVGRLEAQLYDGISTEEIYRRVHQMLQGRKAARYSLKKAILLLGPEGENFEKYVARIFQAQGYETENRLILKGKCVEHEADILLKKDDERILVECKFHNSLGTKSTIQCALYVHARFLDLREKEKLDRIMLITNTRFTSDVEKYAQCVGMELLGWGMPLNKGLEDLATINRIFPITMLQLSRNERSLMLANNFITIDDVINRKRDLSILLGRDSSQKIEKQANEVLY